MPIFLRITISALLAGGVILASLSIFGNQPLFSDLDQFVLVAEEKIHLAQQVQVSSGDIVANKDLSIAVNNIVTGSLFSDSIKIAENSQINGNASFNNLHMADGSEILGTTTDSISLPIIKLPTIPSFQPGTQNRIITKDQTITPGTFNKIEVKPDVTLTLTPGTYNLNKLDLRQNAKLLFSGPTTLNVKEEVRINTNVLIAPTINIPSTDLVINYVGKKPVTIGKESLLSFKLLAQQSKVNLGSQTTFRGQILAKEIMIGESSVLSREDAFEKESDLTKIVEVESVKLIINEIVILFKEGATINDLLVVANFVKGQATGFLPDLEMGKIEVLTNTKEELDNVINLIKTSGNPLIEEVVPNALIL